VQFVINIANCLELLDFCDSRGYNPLAVAIGQL
jgi:hypothetical protein